MLPQYDLTAGCLHEIMIQSLTPVDPVVQVIAMKKFVKKGDTKDRYRLYLADGKNSMKCALLALNAEDLNFNEKAIIKLKKYHKSTINVKPETQVLVVLEVEQLQSGDGLDTIGSPVPLDETKSEPASGATPSSHAAPEPATNGSASAAALNTSVQGRPVFPIVALSPYCNGWVIKARVSNKSSIRTWSNSRGEGKLFSVDLIDETGEIRLTAFRDMVDKYYEYMEIDKVYYISKCQIKPANAQFNTVKNSYEMTMNMDTVVEECLDGDVGAIPKVQYNFVQLGEVAKQNPGSIVDVIAVCKEVGNLDCFTSKKSGRELKKKNIVLVDQSNTSMHLTLWDSQAESFQADDNPVVAIKGAKIGEFGGGISISTVMSSQMKLNPDIVECHRLKAWFDSDGKAAQMKNVSGRTGGSFQAEQMSFLEAQKRGLGNSSANGDFYKVCATILLARPESSVYKACPTPDCNKKVIDQENGFFRCEKCGKDYPNFKYRLIVSMNLADWTTNQWVTLFSAEAEKILESTAEEVGDAFDNDKDALLKIFDKVNFKRFVFTCRVKSETYNDEQRLKTIVVKVEDVNLAEQNSWLHSQCDQLLKALHHC